VNCACPDFLCRPILKNYVRQNIWWDLNENFMLFWFQFFSSYTIGYSFLKELAMKKVYVSNTEWSKSHATHSWHMFYLSKNKLHLNQKTKKKKQCYIKCWKSPPRSIPSLNTEGRPEQFLSCALPVSRKRFTRRDIVNLFGTGESGNVSQNSFWQVK
jgi:hypothetical protein